MTRVFISLRQDGAMGKKQVAMCHECEKLAARSSRCHRFGSNMPSKGGGFVQGGYALVACTDSSVIGTAGIEEGYRNSRDRGQGCPLVPSKALL